MLNGFWTTPVRKVVAFTRKVVVFPNPLTGFVIFRNRIELGSMMDDAASKAVIHPIPLVEHQICVDAVLNALRVGSLLDLLSSGIDLRLSGVPLRLRKDAPKFLVLWFAVLLFLRFVCRRGARIRPDGLSKLEIKEVTFPDRNTLAGLRACSN